MWPPGPHPQDSDGGSVQHRSYVPVTSLSALIGEPFLI